VNRIKFNQMPDVRNLPIPLKALIVGGGFALAGAGCSNSESASHESGSVAAAQVVATSTPESTPDKIPTTQPTPTPEMVSANSSNGDVKSLIDELISSNYTGGDVTAHKNETAVEAIEDGVKEVQGYLPSGITPDEIKTVIENGTPEEVVITKKDFSKPENQWPHIQAQDQVHANDAIIYKFISE
jgi:hypothetical protein